MSAEVSQLSLGGDLQVRERNPSGILYLPSSSNSCDTQCFSLPGDNNGKIRNTLATMQKLTQLRHNSSWTGSPYHLLPWNPMMRQSKWKEKKKIQCWWCNPQVRGTQSVNGEEELRTYQSSAILDDAAGLKWTGHPVFDYVNAKQKSRAVRCI